MEKVWRKGNFCTLLVRIYIFKNYGEKCEISLKLKVELPYYTAFCLLSIYLETNIIKHSFKRMHTTQSSEQHYLQVHDMDATQVSINSWKYKQDGTTFYP